MNNKKFIKGCKVCVVIMWISCIMSLVSTILGGIVGGMIGSVGTSFTMMLLNAIGAFLYGWMAKSVSALIGEYNAICEKNKE